MTLDEFFVALEETRDMGWKCNERGVLRVEVSELVRYCPVTAVAMQRHGTWFQPEAYEKAAELLELARLDAGEIAMSADDAISECPVRAELRSRLLAAVGL